MSAKQRSPRATLTELLDRTAALHSHLCPRQVLGVRMGLLGAELLGLAVPQLDKRLLTIVETDGCAADGVATATNCWVGRRTLRVEDYGKVAATFVDTASERAMRVAPRRDSRELCRRYAPEADTPWLGMLLAYQRAPAEELLDWGPVRLRVPVAEIVSRPALRVPCSRCSEEIMNGRERIGPAGEALCRGCADGGYFELESG